MTNDTSVRFGAPAELHPSCATPLPELEVSHEALRNKFRGMDIIVPDFYRLMPGWNPKVNEVYTNELRKKTNGWLLEYVPELESRTNIRG